ncbi:MAG: ATP-dependent helicase, partial [Holophagales bacterium]|nr:ATP-dependent helicase [Holophagales bacterium]
NAALELRRRLDELVDDDARGVTLCTYHGLALRILGRSLAEAGEVRQETLDSLVPDAVRLLREGGLERSSERGGADSSPSLLLGEAEVDDLRERLLAGFRFVLVDEYQDIQQPQYELIAEIVGRSRKDPDRELHLLAVGDDDQTIYGWSGANVDLLRRFETDYDARTHYLVSCYRSSGHIVDAANHLIAHNRDRMKIEHPIRVDDARANEPKGGRWAVIDPAGGGRVERLILPPAKGDGSEPAAVQAAALAERIGELERLDPDFAWARVAVLARRHDVLEPIRAVLEHRGVPVARMASEGLPPLGRTAEIAGFLRPMAEHRRAGIRAAELLAREEALHGSLDSPWRTILRELIVEWRNEVGEAELPIGAFLDHAYETLAELRRNPVLGHGVRAITVHAAKGLEFPHVFLADGGYGRVRGSRGKLDALREEERRLYYVGMTRAEQTLHLFDGLDGPNPHVALLGADGEDHGGGDSGGGDSGGEKSVSFLTTRQVRTEAAEPAVAGRTYRILGLEDLFLDWAGRQTGAAHRHLEQLAFGSPVGIRSEKPRLVLTDEAGHTVALLSEKGDSRARPLLGRVESARVVAMVLRFRDDSAAEYREKLRVDSWRVPIVELCLGPA